MNRKAAVRMFPAVCFALLNLVAFGQTGPAAPVKQPKPSPQAIANYGKLPLAFEPNRGQSSGPVQWIARGAQYTLLLAGDDAVLEMNKVTPASATEGKPPSVASSALRMSLIGASRPRSANGEAQLAGKINYFTGSDASKWQHDIPTFGKVRLEQVYAGVDLVYYGRQGQLEYDFVAAPGADVSTIRFGFEGAQPAVAANGDLVLPLNGTGTEVRFNKPVVYQTKDGVREPVEASFKIASGRQVSFSVGRYDHARELVIDPTLLFNGIFGTGAPDTIAAGMSVDSAGEIILAGTTSDPYMPVTAGAFQTSCNGPSEQTTRCASYNTSAFVTKISADGTSLIYSTYLHGFGGTEFAGAVATDAEGDAYVLGGTSSNDFPLVNPLQKYCLPNISTLDFDPQIYGPETSECDYISGSGQYATQGPTLFLSKLNPSGSALLYSTFFGGSHPVYPRALALDGAGNIYFSGFLQYTNAANTLYPNGSDLPFPTTGSAYQRYGPGNTQSATLTKLSANGQTVLYSTLLGTSDTANYSATQPLALAVGENGMAYLGGITGSASFPVVAANKSSCVPNPYAPTNCQSYYGFVSAFDTTASGTASLVYSTYVGGDEVPQSNLPETEVEGLATDSSNNLYVAGSTYAYDFQTTPGVFQATCPHNNSADSCNTAYLMKFNSAGHLAWSTFYGGTSTSSTSGAAVALDGGGHVYLYGSNNDYGADLPQVNPIEPYIEQNVVFVAMFSSDATKLLFATRLGSRNQAQPTGVYPIAQGLALDPAGNVYFAAYGADAGEFVSTTGTYNTYTLGGGNRSYFGKISPILPPCSVTAANLTVLAGAAGGPYSSLVSSFSYPDLPPEQLDSALNSITYGITATIAGYTENFVLFSNGSYYGTTPLPTVPIGTPAQTVALTPYLSGPGATFCTFTGVPGSVTIQQPLTLTSAKLTMPAGKPQTYTYGSLLTSLSAPGLTTQEFNAAIANATIGVTVTGGTVSENFAIYSKGTYLGNTILPTVPAGTPAGTYKITPYISGPGASSFALTAVPGSITIP